jgi:multisubunit Na+/H+ antiporter MnhB subunit
MIVGFLGGILGTAVGVLLTVGVSYAREWTPLLDTQLAVGVPLLGAAIGLVACTYPRQEGLRHRTDHRPPRHLTSSGTALRGT